MIGDLCICVYTDISVRTPVIILLFLWGQVSATCCVLLQADQPPVLSHGFRLGHWPHCVHGCLSAGRLPCWRHTGQGSSFLIPACLSVEHHVSSVYWQKAQLFKKCKDILSNIIFICFIFNGFCCNLCVCVHVKQFHRRYASGLVEKQNVPYKIVQPGCVAFGQSLVNSLSPPPPPPTSLSLLFVYLDSLLTEKIAMTWSGGRQSFVVKTMTRTCVWRIIFLELEVLFIVIV